MILLFFKAVVALIFYLIAAVLIGVNYCEYRDIGDSAWKKWYKGDPVFRRNIPFLVFNWAVLLEFTASMFSGDIVKLPAVFSLVFSIKNFFECILKNLSGA